MKNKIKYLPIGILTLTTTLSGVALSSGGVAADTMSGSKGASVTVAAACTFSGSTSYTANMEIYAGTTVESDATRAPYEVKCNNPNGFQIQAIGSSPDAGHPEGLDGNNFLYGGSLGNIATGTSESNSYWAFKIGFAYASEGTYTIATGYNDYHTVPGGSSSAATVVTYSGATGASVSGLFRPDYKVYAKVSQAAGTYTGKVKYTLVPVSS